MNASSVPRMVLVDRTVPGRRLARHGLYHHSVSCSPARPPTAAVLSAAARLQPYLYGGHFPARPFCRLCPRRLPVCCLLVPDPRPFPRDHPPRLAALVARTRRAAASAQPRPVGRSAPRLAPPSATGGHRPDPGR